MTESSRCNKLPRIHAKRLSPSTINPAIYRISVRVLQRYCGRWETQIVAEITEFPHVILIGVLCSRCDLKAWIDGRKMYINPSQRGRHIAAAHQIAE